MARSSGVRRVNGKIVERYGSEGSSVNSTEKKKGGGARKGIKKLSESGNLKYKSRKLNTRQNTLDQRIANTKKQQTSGKKQTEAAKAKRSERLTKLQEKKANTTAKQAKVAERTQNTKTRLNKSVERVKSKVESGKMNQKKGARRIARRTKAAKS